MKQWDNRLPPHDDECDVPQRGNRPRTTMIIYDFIGIINFNRNFIYNVAIILYIILNERRTCFMQVRPSRIVGSTTMGLYTIF
jgi:hypothetical protein